MINFNFLVNLQNDLCNQRLQTLTFFSILPSANLVCMVVLKRAKTVSTVIAEQHLRLTPSVPNNLS